MTDKKSIRVFCPVHEAAFEVESGPKILCEITGHALSTQFPDSEVWEYCCNCATFAPSQLGKGEKARPYCFTCQTEISTRFACSNCMILSFEGKGKSKGQMYSISDQGIVPACPGCEHISAGSIVSHACDELDAKIFTSREKCSFCLENTRVDFVMPGGAPADTIVCQNCRAVNPAIAAFCGKCKYQLRSSVDITSFGTDDRRTQLLGSLCPNCSTPVPTNSDFCGECGQAVKSSAPPPPPPPPPRQSTGESNILKEAIDAGKSAYYAEKENATAGQLGNPTAIANILKDPIAKVIGIGVIGIILFIGLITAISSKSRVPLPMSISPIIRSRML